MILYKFQNNFLYIKKLIYQKYNDKLGMQTQTSILLTSIELGLKYENQGVIKGLAFSQNHGPP